MTHTGTYLTYISLIIDHTNLQRLDSDISKLADVGKFDALACRFLHRSEIVGNQAFGVG